ncbi:MAG: peptidase S41, partial [Caldithrix sp.]|nr:peptidase S41 [Caldithrix sp.]
MQFLSRRINAQIFLHFILSMLLISVFTQPVRADEQRPLMRFPDIHEDWVVFVHDEDIWKAPADGGTAIRLTIHDGAERYPKFSPDGSQIAFTGEYDGNIDVYVMDVHGGNITRLTYHPGYDVVVGWHEQNNKIIFRSGRKSFNRFTRLFMVSPDGSGMETIILHEAAQGSFSPDGNQIAYNKIARENRTWKRYKGGMAQDIYVYDLQTDERKQLTDFKGTDRLPMWMGSTIYFSSDRDGILNLYAYDLNNQNQPIRKLTDHQTYDVRRPSIGKDNIIYEIAGQLWVYNVNTEATQQIQVNIKADAAATRPYLKKVDKNITHIDVSPNGERALIVARGEVFTAPREHGSIHNLTRNSGTRDKDAAWSPDGRKIAYLSDASGEYEIYIIDAKGNRQTVKLTQHEEGYRHTLRWSPDGKKIAFADHSLRCYYLDVDRKNITEIDKAHFENVDVALKKKPISDFRWSPDSRYITYSKMNSELLYQVYVYDLKTDEIHRVSNGLFNDFGPVFSTDGRRLFFISNRRFSPTYGDLEWEMVYKKVAGIYALTLHQDGDALFAPRSDEAAADESNNDDSGETAMAPIDFEGIADRIEAFPLPRGNYRQLSAADDALYYLNKDEGDFNRFEFRSIGPRNLHAFSFADRKEQNVIEKIDGYKLSANGSHIVYKQKNNVGIIPASARDSKGHHLDLSGLEMWIDPLAEWTQIYNEAWRMERDYYYEPNMNGLDWPAVREKYARLLPYASCRQDIRYIIGEMIGELSTSHTYVFGGDLLRDADRVNVGMLGVEWAADEQNQRYRFEKIYKVPDWTRDIIPPLSRLGVDVQEGEYLLAVNGQNVTTGRNIYSYFQNLAGKQVELMVNDRPDEQGARTVIVEPLRSSGTLRYLDWVEHNRKVAEEASDGQIGYIHLPDTYNGSAREFPKYFHSQLRKKGIIVDGRYNAGGLDPDIFLQRLDKEVLAYWT